MISLFLIQTTFAGIETGAILGSVSDANGEPIPGATITASNQSMIGWNSSAYSGDDGYYRFPALPPGSYEVKVELAGFQTIVRKEIRLFVGNSLTIDFVLSLQPVSETIEISGNSPALDVTTPATPAIVPQEYIENLPKSLASFSTGTALERMLRRFRRLPVLQMDRDGSGMLAGERNDFVH
jgi:hypothetical protein